MRKSDCVEPYTPININNQLEIGKELHDGTLMDAGALTSGGEVKGLLNCQLGNVRILLQYKAITDKLIAIATHPCLIFVHNA